VKERATAQGGLEGWVLRWVAKAKRRKEVMRST
jgi:hypothetical protein